MTLTAKSKRMIAEIALLLCGIIWGSGFVVMKNTLDNLSVNYLLGIRFVLAALLMFAFMFRRMLRVNKQTVLGGIAAGAAIYSAFFFQTFGLTTTTAGNNAFLTAVYVLLVPLLQWALYKQRPGRNTLFAGIICLVGVGLIALNQFSIAIGDVWTLLGGILFAVHIVIVAHFTDRGVNALELTCIQFAVTGLIALAFAVPFETAPSAAVLFSNETLLALLYLVGLCTLFAMITQNVALRYAPASHASLLMGTEAPFGCLFGILLLGEPFTLRFFLGAAMIAGSIVISELGHFSKKAGNAQNASL